MISASIFDPFSHRLDPLKGPDQLGDMSLLELKQAASRLSKREREELHAYLIRLNHNTPAWKRTTAKRIRAMQGGKRVSAEELETRIVRG